MSRVKVEIVTISNLGNDAAVNRPSQVHTQINPLNISSGSHSKKYILKYDQCSLSQFVLEDKSFRTLKPLELHTKDDK